MATLSPGTTTMPGFHPARPDPAGLLDELKRMAVEQLSAVPSGLYRPIEDQLQQNPRATPPTPART